MPNPNKSANKQIKDEKFATEILLLEVLKREGFEVANRIAYKEEKKLVTEYKDATKVEITKRIKELENERSEYNSLDY